MIRKNSGRAAMALAFLLLTGMLYAQGIPERPSPPRLVNDFAGLLGGNEIRMLENKLVDFDDSTSTQIAIVIVNDFAGYEKEEYAQRLGEKWGIGQKGKNNGLVIVVKPKTAESRGEVFIKPGYGAEGAVPDLICAKIVDNEILPAFRNGNYYKGLDKATGTIISLLRGEFTADQYSRRSHSDIKRSAPVALFIIFFVIMTILRGIGRSNNSNLSRGSGLPFWLLLSMMNSGRGASGGSWGGFSGGGGGGGGFGGFGGGSFGGGGAGGSW
ncbi:MAG TPA: TPM domain-containing protein [Bacteroidales bacterium]|nr:TPM domain-containing protein [Bacteroidales bacterium]